MSLSRSSASIIDFLGILSQYVPKLSLLGGKKSRQLLFLIGPVGVLFIILPVLAITLRQLLWKTSRAIRICLMVSSL
jgi:hypothetical protein